MAWECRTENEMIYDLRSVNPKRFSLTICGALVAILSGCSVGGKYGGSTMWAAIPNQTTTLAKFVESFLVHEFYRLGCTGKPPERVSSLDVSMNYAEFLVRNLRSCVVPNEKLWEEVKVIAFVLGGTGHKLGLNVEGWYASGMYRPSEFKNMDPEFIKALQEFSQKLRSDLETYAASEIEQ